MAVLPPTVGVGEADGVTLGVGVALAVAVAVAVAAVVALAVGLGVDVRVGVTLAVTVVMVGVGEGVALGLGVAVAGLGAAVNDSGMRRHSERITKAGRRDLRYTTVQAAHHAVEKHPHWQVQFERLGPRLGRAKAVVAIARKLLIAIWHVLTEGVADKYADPEKVAYSLFQFAYRVGVNKLPGDVSALQYTRDQLDRLEIGQDLTQFSNGTRQPKLPKSRRAPASPEAPSLPAAT